MRKIIPAILIGAFALSLVACKKNEPAPLTPGSDAASEQAAANDQPPALPVEPPADAVIPVTVAANAFAIGSAKGADNKAISPKQSYGVDDTVYASLPTGKYPRGGVARVYWTYQDGTSHKEEEKPVSDETVSFEFSKADGMKPGKYNVEIDVNDKPVGIVDFNVK